MTATKRTILALLFMLTATTAVAARRGYWTPQEIFETITLPRLSKAEVIDLLGQPDTVGKYEGQARWMYRCLTRDITDNTVWNQSLLFNEAGRAWYDWTPTPCQLRTFLPFVTR